MNNQPEFNLSEVSVGDKVLLSPVPDEKGDTPPDAVPLNGSIQGIGNHVAHVEVATPPEWYRRRERASGLFSNSEARLWLFKDHQGTWTEAHSLRQFTIKKV